MKFITGKEAKILRGGRTYNGLPSKLMNEIYDDLIIRIPDFVKQYWWVHFSLYLARICRKIEERHDL